MYFSNALFQHGMNDIIKIINRYASGRRIYISFLLIFLSCVSVIDKHEAWEGIRGNTLRVFVKLDIPYAEEHEHASAPMAERLMDAGLNRAGVILMGYIRIHMTDFERIETCRQKIGGLQKKGKMMYQKCTDASCIAFIDFDITEFLEAAGRSESAP
jgi:hypothetical protein